MNNSVFTHSVCIILNCTINLKAKAVSKGITINKTIAARFEFKRIVFEADKNSSAKDVHFMVSFIH